MSAAAASRDVTLFHAYDLLHKHDYKLDEAVKVFSLFLQLFQTCVSHNVRQQYLNNLETHL